MSLQTYGEQASSSSLSVSKLEGVAHAHLLRWCQRFTAVPKGRARRRQIRSVGTRRPEPLEEI
jgi:hypothetical protein